MNKSILKKSIEDWKQVLSSNLNTVGERENVYDGDNHLFSICESHTEKLSGNCSGCFFCGFDKGPSSFDNCAVVNWLDCCISNDEMSDIIMRIEKEN